MELEWSTVSFGQYAWIKIFREELQFFFKIYKQLYNRR